VTTATATCYQYKQIFLAMATDIKVDVQVSDSSGNSTERETTPKEICPGAKKEIKKKKKKTNRYYFRSTVRTSGIGVSNSYGEGTLALEEWIAWINKDHKEFEITDRFTFNNSLKCNTCCPFIGPFYHQVVLFKIENGDERKWLLMEKLRSGIYCQIDSCKNTVLKNKSNFYGANLP
jgi:hypothetical protein